MFFPERIASIEQNDRVLEIGPGGTPHPRANVFLEKIYENPDDARRQRGKTPALKTDKEIFFYEGDKFPFNDDEFDYVICSHVLEHVENVDIFISEINRIAKKGYLEYPTVYYDYIYDFPEHTTFVLKRKNTINWMLKKETCLDKFKNVNSLFYQSLMKGHNGIIDDLKEFLFQGFEWSDVIITKHVTDIEHVCYNIAEIDIPENQMLRKKKQDTSMSNKIKVVGNLFKLFRNRNIME